MDIEGLGDFFDQAAVTAVSGIFDKFVCSENSDCSAVNNYLQHVSPGGYGVQLSHEVVDSALGGTVFDFDVFCVVKI